MKTTIVAQWPDGATRTIECDNDIIATSRLTAMFVTGSLAGESLTAEEIGPSTERWCLRLFGENFLSAGDRRGIFVTVTGRKPKL